MSFVRKDVEFISKGAKCAAWLYLPEKTKNTVKNPPVVIMAHGFAAERTFRLPAFAERFVNSGMAVLLFDYRNFGASEGTPRNLVNPFRHVEDWKAAVAHVRSIDEVNSDKIALWGSSFGGGHVVVTAAKDAGISAVVAQVPMLDGLTSLLMIGPINMIKGSFLGMRDLLRIITFREPFYVPVVAVPEKFGVMNKPDSKPGYLAIVPDDSPWENKCPARIALLIGLYRPIKFAKKVKCPALIVTAEDENLVSPKSTAKATKRMKKGTLVTVPGGHFDVYVGENFERIVKLQADFLEEHLLGQ